MDRSFWQQRWDEGRIGFHRHEVNPGLVAHADAMTGGQPSNVLVPCCGKTHDMAWLARHGHTVVGVEFVPEAVEQFFADEHIASSTGSFRVGERWTGGGITVLRADFFTLTREHIGDVTCAYDRGSMIALPPDMRGPYARKLLELLPSGARILLLSLHYDSTEVEGPPWSVTPDEVRELYGEACELEILDEDPAAGGPARFAELGITIRDTTWLLTVR